MKSLIVPIVAIVGLAALFVIVDRRELMRRDDSQTGQMENTVLGHRSSRQGTTSTDAVMREDRMTVSEQKSTARPVAIPVTTPEEAEKLNDFALFLSTAKETVVEGEIIERSELPDPKGSDYPNCRFTAHFVGNAISSGEPCPKELALLLEGFKDYSILETDELTTGDKVQCHVIPFESLPEEFQATQQADDLNLFLLETYYVVDVEKINAYSDDPLVPKSGIFFLDGNADYISVFERHINPPIPIGVIDAQEKTKLSAIMKTIDEVQAVITEVQTLLKISESKSDENN